MKCHEARELLIHYSNGEIGRSERELLQAHLAQCESCFQHLQSLSNIEQQVRTGLHEAADAAEPSSLAWQELSHKLADRRNPRSTTHTPLPLVWRLMGGLGATLAFAALVGTAITSPLLNPARPPLVVTEDAQPMHTEALNTAPETNAAIESKTNFEQDSVAANARTIASAPQKQTRTLLQSEPDSFLLRSQVHDDPEIKFFSQIDCFYCLKMR